MAGLTVDNPVTFTMATNSARVIPGDTLQLRAGTYRGTWRLPWSGTEASPITVTRYPGESPVIDGSLTFVGSYIKVIDLEIMNSNTDRTVVTDAITMNNPGCWLIGCNIHDLHSSGVSWFGSGVGGVVECLIYNNGYLDADEIGHGHGIYTHNNLGGARQLARNIFFDQLGDYTIHIYSGGDNALKDYTVEDNSICGYPVHTGGGLGMLDFIYRNNIQYQNYCQHGRYSGSNQNQRGNISNNTFIGLSAYSVNADCDLPWADLTEADNLVYGGEPAAREGYTQTEIPATLVKLVQFSKSERWLGSVSIFNRDSAETVAVDFTSILADGNYRLRNGQNPSETWDFVAAGEAVNVPTNFTAAARIGDVTPPTTWPIFGAFVIEAR